ILEKVAPQSCQIRLHDNDLILIFSDGVADAFPDEAALIAAISRCVYQDPQRTADALLRQALISAGGIPKDDMTVLAARLTQWSAPASPISYAASL
ncbi:MAG: SpoIIE family protein phosphatase, partial [Clostridia bacterium]|nr:SpoIIE family protein phosphatase [Clostridia bacterium]